MTNYINKIIDLLKQYNHPHMLVTETSIRRLKKAEREKFYNSLNNANQTKSNRVNRPKCPVTENGSTAQARYPYKKAMVEYIAKWNIMFEENPSNLTPSLLESTANFLEKNYSKK